MASKGDPVTVLAFAYGMCASYARMYTQSLQCTVHIDCHTAVFENFN